MTNEEIQKYKKRLDKLKEQQRIAKIKKLEKQMKREILKLRFPFLFNLKFNKVIVVLCILSILIYTVASVVIQKCTLMEISPTLTTCVYGFFGTELIGLAGIRIFDKKYEMQTSSINYNENVTNDNNEIVG